MSEKYFLNLFNHLYMATLRQVFFLYHLPPNQLSPCHLNPSLNHVAARVSLDSETQLTTYNPHVSYLMSETSILKSRSRSRLSECHSLYRDRDQDFKMPIPLSRSRL